MDRHRVLTRAPTGWETPNDLALLTDLYELTMVQAYVAEGMQENAVFSLFVRRLPANRKVLLACGLDSVLEYLEQVYFSDEAVAYVASLERFSKSFLEWLSRFRFTGAVYAVPEGTPIFANEPILEVVAPLPQAQLVETFIMNQIHVQTVLASKAQRIVLAAGGRPVIDFGPRRMHGIDAAVKAGRAFHIAGVAATSNVLAGHRYGVPVTGTMAHSYIQAHDNEVAAFGAFARLYPETVLLVDTYDTLDGVRKTIELSRTLGKDFGVSGVRLDSGDLGALARQARQLLDKAGLQKVGIFASGGLDEDEIAALVSSGAPIDGFGVGTSMGVSDDAPTLDLAYKLCEYAGQGRLKLSTGKPVLPGRKQVFRIAHNGRDIRDVIGRADETLPGRPLLCLVMRQGRRLPPGTVALDNIRAYAREQIVRLPENLKTLEKSDTHYPVEISSALVEYQRKVTDHVRQSRGNGKRGA